MDKRVVLLAALGLTALSATPAAAQADAWQRKWFWGAQGGVFLYQTPTTTKREMAITAGGHWLITSKRSALLIGFDQVMFPDSSTSQIADPIVPSGLRQVNFTSGRRIQAMLYAIPSDGVLQVMLGGGFAIQQISNATPAGPFLTLAELTNANVIVANQDTRAFFVVSGGFQLRKGRWALFANYQFMPPAKNFLISSGQHAMMAGLRFALTTAHEDVTTER